MHYFEHRCCYSILSILLRCESSKPFYRHQNFRFLTLSLIRCCQTIRNTVSSLPWYREAVHNNLWDASVLYSSVHSFLSSLNVFLNVRTIPISGLALWMVNFLTDAPTELFWHTLLLTIQCYTIHLARMWTYIFLVSFHQILNHISSSINLFTIYESLYYCISKFSKTLISQKCPIQI